MLFKMRRSTHQGSRTFDFQRFPRTVGDFDFWMVSQTWYRADSIKSLGSWCVLQQRKLWGTIKQHHIKHRPLTHKRIVRQMYLTHEGLVEFMHFLQFKKMFIAAISLGELCFHRHMGQSCIFLSINHLHIGASCKVGFKIYSHLHLLLLANWK